MPMRHFLLACTLLASTLCLSSSVAKDRLSVSLLTGAPGQDLYSYFGHTAIRVIDSARGTDLVYNYGVFDFNTPNFYLKFLQGKLLYQLDVNSWKATLREYQFTGRRLTEQQLNLDPQSKEDLLQFLEINYRPENRYYLYDFFHDNCATRVRDALEQALGDDLHYPSPTTSGPTWVPSTYRDYLHEILAPHPWTVFGIDLVLGMPADQVMDFRDEMFLPDDLSTNLSQATLNGRPLTGTPLEILPARIESASTVPLLIRPVSVCALLTILCFLSVWWNTVKWPPLLDTLLAVASGLGGMLIIGLWFATDHNAVKENWNILFLNPVFLISGISGVRSSRFLNHATGIAGGIALTAGCLAPLLPQDIHPGAAILGIGIGLRMLHSVLSR